MQTEIKSLKQQKITTTRTITKPKYYCWSHGCTNKLNHTSLNCFNRNPGHKDWAIFERKEGGNTKIVRINLDKLDG